MPKPRARFGAALLRGRLYTIGGSDGTKDLKSVNYFDFASQRWKQAASLNKERSYVGEYCILYTNSVIAFYTQIQIN